MPVTRDQAQMLATLATQARPTGATRWDAAGVIAAIGRVKHLHLADVALAVFRAADDRNINTPAPIGDTRSTCWRERATDRPQPREPFDRATFCGVCSEPQDRCRARWADDHEFIPAGKLRPLPPPDNVRDLLPERRVQTRDRRPFVPEKAETEESAK